MTDWLNVLSSDRIRLRRRSVIKHLLMRPAHLDAVVMKIHRLRASLAKAEKNATSAEQAFSAAAELARRLKETLRNAKQTFKEARRAFKHARRNSRKANRERKAAGKKHKAAKSALARLRKKLGPGARSRATTLKPRAPHS